MSIESRSKQYGSIFGNWHIGRRLDDGSNNKSAVFELYRNSNGWTEQSALKVIGLIEERGSWDKLTPYRWNEYSTAAREVRSSAEQEVRLMEQLRSQTHIVDYLDHSFFDWRDETGFGVDLLIRMELLNCLRTEMRAGRQFDDAEIIKIGKDICSALVLCHEKNIIHRDIKPENIFFNSNGDYKLGDFGISRIIKESPSAMASTGVGTPAYAAPEQSSGAYDKRADIYSLGLVLYELCNGNRLPFARSSYVGEDEIRLRMSGTPLPLPGNPISDDPFMTHAVSPSENQSRKAAADPYATRKAQHSEKLIRVIMKACAFRQENRFATAQEMLDALMDKTPDPSPNPSLSSSPNSNPSLNPNPPKIIMGIAICAVLLILAAGVSWWIWKHRPDPNPTPEPTLEATPEPTAATEHVHVWGEWMEIISPSCEDVGYESRTCTIDESHVESRNIPARGHDWAEATETMPMTCRLCGKQIGSPLQLTAEQKLLRSLPLGDAPSAADLDAIHTDIVYPREESYYLSAYEVKYIQPTSNHTAVYAFINPYAGTRAGNYFTVPKGEPVVVLANGNQYSCAIIPSKNRAAWINTDYLADR